MILSITRGVTSGPRNGTGQAGGQATAAYRLVTARDNGSRLRYYWPGKVMPMEKG
jgi:hypothetical protein